MTISALDHCTTENLTHTLLSFHYPCECKCESCYGVQLFATPWTVVCQAPLCTEFSRPEYLSGLPFHFPGDLPNQGIELRSPALQADSFPPGNPRSYHKWLIESSSDFSLHFASNPKYTVASAKQATICPHLPFSFVLDAARLAAEPQGAQAHTLR